MAQRTPFSVKSLQSLKRNWQSLLYHHNVIRLNCLAVRWSGGRGIQSMDIGTEFCFNQIDHLYLPINFSSSMSHLHAMFFDCCFQREVVITLDPLGQYMILSLRAPQLSSQLSSAQLVIGQNPLHPPHKTTLRQLAHNTVRRID